MGVPRKDIRDNSPAIHRWGARSNPPPINGGATNTGRTPAFEKATRRWQTGYLVGALHELPLHDGRRNKCALALTRSKTRGTHETLDKYDFSTAYETNYNCRSLGSSLSLSQSPIKFVPRTVIMIARPAKVGTHQAVER